MRPDTAVYSTATGKVVTVFAVFCYTALYARVSNAIMGMRVLTHLRRNTFVAFTFFSLFDLSQDNKFTEWCGQQISECSLLYMSRIIYIMTDYRYNSTISTTTFCRNKNQGMKNCTSTLVL